MSNTPRVEAVVGPARDLDPSTDFVKLAAIYSDLLQLARELERELADRVHYAEQLHALLMRARDGMEQVCDHATGDDGETGIPYRIPNEQSIGAREGLVYVPLNELDGIRMALEEIAALSKNTVLPEIARINPDSAESESGRVNCGKCDHPMGCESECRIKAASDEVLGVCRALPKRQGPCETTLTERWDIGGCQCPTYPGNLGPCLTWTQGRASDHCVYCDHSLACHRTLSDLFARETPSQVNPLFVSTCQHPENRLQEDGDLQWCLDCYAERYRLRGPGPDGWTEWEKRLLPVEGNPP